MKHKRKPKRRPAKNGLAPRLRRLRVFTGLCAVALPLFGALAVFTLESYGRQHETR